MNSIYPVLLADIRNESGMYSILKKKKILQKPQKTDVVFLFNQTKYPVSVVFADFHHLAVFFLFFLSQQHKHSSQRKLAYINNKILINHLRQ